MQMQKTKKSLKQSCNKKSSMCSELQFYFRCLQYWKSIFEKNVAKWKDNLVFDNSNKKINYFLKCWRCLGWGFGFGVLSLGEQNQTKYLNCNCRADGPFSLQPRHPLAAAGEKCFLSSLYLYTAWCMTVKLVYNAFKIFIVPTFS